LEGELLGLIILGLEGTITLDEPILLVNAEKIFYQYIFENENIF
jgi:hypothetical protein